MQAFASTAVTIVSGATLGRTKIEAYVVLAFFITAFVQPVVTHSFTGGGFLVDKKIADFAGCGSVHVVGGTAGLCAACFVGPRQKRFGTDSASIDWSNNFYSGSSVYQVLGTFILWVGWYAFNAGGIHRSAVLSGDEQALDKLYVVFLK